MPDILCSYGLNWNKNKEGYLLSGSDDAVVCLWDISGTPKETNVLEPLSKYEAHVKVVEVIHWNHFVNSNSCRMSRGIATTTHSLVLWAMTRK